MIEVFLSHKRFAEISLEGGNHLFDFDGGLRYLLDWCGQNCQHFYVGQRGYGGESHNFALGFVFRFAIMSDALRFKLTWA